MARIRAVIQSCRDLAENDELIERAHQTREEPGCLQFEYFRSLDYPENVALVELWESQEIYDRHWSSGRAGPSPSARPPVQRRYGQNGAEFYQQTLFALVDNVWMPADPALRSRAIMWPSTGAIRIVIQTSPPGLDERIPGMIQNAVETRKEPGCIQFEFFRSIEFPEASLLLELWQDQPIYDAHWNLRLQTGQAGGGAGPRPEPVPRRHGQNGFEFYHAQSFVRVDGAWAPAAPDQRGTTVRWAH